uniref:Transmembrane protein 94 n=1 Tax=Salmo trutta TaxID=8032 RepID=A0A673Z243_SALTR
CVCVFQEEGGVGTLGLSTGQALGTLRDQLTTLLDQHQTTGRGKQPTAQWVKSFLHHGNRHSCLHWPGAALTLLVVVGLLCCYGNQPHGSSGIELVNAAALLMLFTLSFMLIGRQQRLRRTEMVHRLNSIINQLNDLGEGMRWSPSLYPDLYTPSSPSWSLHWTYRDSNLVNLPVSLLVEGDVIALRPGQETFASLRGINDDDHIVLEPGDMFPPRSPPPSPRGDQKRGPQSPQQHRLFRVVRTPILDSVRWAILDLALSRPITALDNERFTVQSIMAKFACPIVLMAFLVVNTVRYFFDAPSLTPGRFNFIQLQLMGVLPILPLLFPVMWVLVNTYGEASVLAESSRASPTGLLAKFSEDTLSSYTEVVSSQEMLRCVWRHLVGVLKGESQTLCYTSSLLHTLGSVTVLCCVDKRGVLSWPNPSPETVLFFSGRVEPPHNDSQEDLRDDLSVNSEDRDETQEGEALLCMPMMDGYEPSETSHDTGCSQARETHPRTKHPSGSNVSFSHDTDGGDQEDYVCDYHLEMLSLSQDQQNPVSIQFDEQGWQCHLPSLKPLGLNILLNLCNASVTQQLCRFSDHLSNLALQESHGAVLPVHVPWGLCELSRLIGFTPGARELFKQENHLALYQMPCGEKAKESVPRRQHNFTKRQPPISHLISLFIRDSSSNNVQMLSHGSADLILEACTDVWDGSDIYPLSGSDRKKVLDFYQRACLSGYCSAFAYKPMQVSLSNQLNGKCVELAPGPNLFSGVELPSTTPIKHVSRRNSWSSDDMQCSYACYSYACVSALNLSLCVAMCEMIKIMQENREVTCCLGSSANFRNSCLFLQSDLSIALDPLYPSRCSWETFGYAIGAGLNGEVEGLSPLSLSGQLNTLACSVTFHQGESVSMVKLIEQFLACLAQLPPPMNITDILWLSCFSCPLLSILLMTCTITQTYFLGCFLLKFGLTVCAYLLGFGFTLHEVCLRTNNLTLAENTTINCTDILSVSSARDAPHWFRELSNGLLLTQKVMAGFLALHTVVISLSYVHRSQPLWKKNPFSNTWWCLTVLVVLLGQMVQATVDYKLWQDRSGSLTFGLKDIPMLAWLLVSLSCLVVVLLNEAVKLHEIRVRVRYQKRQKLQFETKLGMNSPF